MIDEHFFLKNVMSLERCQAMVSIQNKVTGVDFFLSNRAFFQARYA
jgi:hypothetical protein